MKAQTYPAESFFLRGEASERLTLTIEKAMMKPSFHHSFFICGSLAGCYFLDSSAAFSKNHFLEILS